MGSLLSALIPIAGALISGSGVERTIAAVIWPSVQSAFGGAAITAALQDITVTQWLSLGIDLAEASPSIGGDLRKLWGALHPTLAQFVRDLDEHLPDGARAAADFASRNMAARIPGYAADGSVTEIPNPDLKQGEVK